MGTIAQNQKNVRLEDIGSDKSSFGTVKLNAVEEKLIDLAILFKTTAENELSIQQAIDTGLLADSIQFEGVKYLGGVYSVDIKVLSYFKFINSGVRGTQSGRSTSGFQFKNNYVSKDMLKAIRGWLVRHGLKSSAKEVRKKPLGTEKKTHKFGSDTSNSLAYAIATSIKKKGIKPTGFWDKAASKTEQDMANSMGNAFAIDIINEITK